MKKGKPEKIQKILIAIHESIINTGASPTLEEIAQTTGMSKSSVDRYLIFMKEQGMIDGYHDKKRRAARITDPNYFIADTHHIPVVGSIACGTPILAEENIDEYIDITKTYLGDGEYFGLKAKGNSMIGAGIADGDVVIVRKQPDAETSQIVVALINDEATLKRYYPEPQNNRIRLHPENGDFGDIYVDDCVIQGVAVKIIKSIK